MKIILEIPDDTMHKILKTIEKEHIKIQEGLDEFAAKMKVDPAPAYRKTVEEMIVCAIEEYCG